MSSKSIKRMRPNSDLREGSAPEPSLNDPIDKGGYLN